jgi:putative membrane protein
MKSTYLKILKQSRSSILIAVLIIFYTVGTIGILTPEYHAYFLSLSFFNLLLSFVIVLLADNTHSLRFYIFILLCFLVGFAAEVIGTKTGLLFGNYFYGNNLGMKISGVPLVIGINWGILVITSASIINRLNLSLLPSVVLSSLLMTALDLLMEPVAIESDYWTWVGGSIPIYNYVCWFLVALPLHYIYFKLKLVKSNKVYDALFIILILFFSLLNIF